MGRDEPGIRARWRRGGGTHAGRSLFRIPQPPGVVTPSAAEFGQTRSRGPGSVLSGEELETKRTGARGGAVAVGEGARAALVMTVEGALRVRGPITDRKSTRLNSSH